ncbi:thioesterase II family protein [Kitasatospora aureofaciens]|uniref:thioesterase II family protein n=1 Tax=Kitasatospora aureofaciens TaxID=1894 RepID=UPI001C45E08E|nr:alpha/beta fold hydrolase [Kitasatospora aureofaciens]MBV6699864.1 alpha/beta fold hydrolase [Kitasatospora aureofaciens]
MTMSLSCFPYAGAGAGVYRPSRRRAGEVLRVEPIQYAGREECFTEPFYADLTAAAEDCAAQVLKAADGGPFAFFGHSFGAVVAYETAQLLAAAGGPLPEHLVVSGAAGPGVPRIATGILQADDEELVRQVAELMGSVPESFGHRGLRELLLPVFRADVALHEAYTPSLRGPLPVPVTILLGSEDRLVNTAQARQWGEVTAVGHRFVEIPGGHMYLTEDWELLWETVEAALETPLEAPLRSAAR